MQFSLADLDAIFRDPQDLLFNLEPQQFLEQGMVESHEALDRSIFESRETHNNLMDDDSKDFLGEGPPPGLIADNFDPEDMDVDVESDPLLDLNNPPEPDFDKD